MKLLLKTMLKILPHCTVPKERLEAFCYRLLEVGLDKCTFLKNRKLTKQGEEKFADDDKKHSTKESLTSILHYLEIEFTYVPWKADLYTYMNFGIKFLLMFVERYRQKQINTFVTRKDFASIWDFLESISFALFSEKDIELANGLTEATKQTLKDWLGSFTSIDDYVKYLETAKASNTSLLGIDYSFNYRDYYPQRNAEADMPSLRACFALNSQQLKGFLKTHVDYQKVLKALVVDFLIWDEKHEHIKNSSFVTDQVNVLMRMNREMTLSVLYELKANYPKALEKTWREIETHVLAPDRAATSPLLAALLKLTRTSDRENELFVKVSQALKDETLCRDLVAIDAQSDQPVEAALTKASIQLLYTFYESLKVPQSDAKSIEKQLVAHTLILFMTLQKPSAEHFKGMIHALYALKQKYQLSDASIDHQLITDILILRAQSLHTAEEFKEYADLLTEIQKQYPFPEGSIEQELKAAVEHNLFLLEHPNVQGSSQTKSIAEFNPKALFNHFGLGHYLDLFESLSTLRKTYQLSLEQADRQLIEQLLIKGISRIKPSPTWNAHYYFPIALRFCAACQGDSELLHSAFNILEKSLTSHLLLKYLRKTPLEQQFIRYVMNKDTNRIFELFKKPKESIQARDKTISRIYKVLKSQGMPELMRSDFLKTYFAECATFRDYQKFAEFVVYNLPYEDQAAPELLKQLTEKLTLTEYEALTQKLIEYAAHERKPTDKLERFLFSEHAVTSPLLISLLKMTKSWKYKAEIFIKLFRALKGVDPLVNPDPFFNELLRTQLTIPCIELLHTFYALLKATESYDNSIESRLIYNIFHEIINNISTAGEMIYFIAFLCDLAETHQKVHALKNSQNNEFITPSGIFNLSNVLLTDKEFINLANLLTNCSYLKTISLNKNQLSHSNSKALIKLLHAAPSLTTLNISGNLQLGVGIFQNRLQLSALPTLTQLDLSHNGLNHEVMAEFLLWIKKSPSLRMLNLSGNKLGSQNLSGFSQYFTKPGAVLLANQLSHFSQLKTLTMNSCELNVTDIKLLAGQLAQKPEASIHVQNNLLDPKDVQELMELSEIGQIGNIITIDKKSKKHAKQYPSVTEGFIDELHGKLECYHTGNQAISSGLVKRRATEPYERALKIAKKLIKAVPVVCHLADGIDALHHLGKTVTQIKKMSRVWQFATTLPMLKEIKHELKVMVHGKEGTPKERAKHYAHLFIGQTGRETLEHFIELIKHYYQGPIEKCVAGSELVLAKSVFQHLKLGMLAMKHNESPESVDTFLLNWLMWVDLMLGKVTLKTGEEIAIAHLFRYAGFMCRNEKNEEILFDMQIEVDGKIFRTDGARYGYRVADKRIVDELSMQLKTYGEIRYQKKFNFDEATLQRYQGCQLQVIPVDCQCYGNRLKRSEDEIKNLKNQLILANIRIQQLETIAEIPPPQQNSASFQPPLFVETRQRGKYPTSESDNELTTTPISALNLTNRI